MRRLFNLKQAAELLGVSRSQMYVLKRRGDVPCVKIGSSTKVDSKALYAYIDGLAEATGAQPALAHVLTEDQSGPRPSGGPQHVSCASAV